MITYSITQHQHALPAQFLVDFRPHVTRDTPKTPLLSKFRQYRFSIYKKKKKKTISLLVLK